MHSTYIYVGFLTILVAIAGCSSGSQTVYLQDLPDTRSVNVPVEVNAASFDYLDEPLILTPVGEESKSIVFQSTPAIFQAPDTIRIPPSSAYCGILPVGLSSDAYEVRSSTGEQATFSLVEEDGRLKLMEGEQPVLAYNYGMQLPEGMPEEFRRSSYIHPIWDLKGTVVTDDFPEDHLHHRGLSWMWPRVFVGGKEFDLWALRGMEQVFDKWLLQDTGPACSTIGVKNHWEVMEDGRNVVDEWVWVRAFRAGQHGRAIDVRITLEAREPLEIAGRGTDNKGYGGFSLRFGPRDATTIRSSDGRETEDSDHKRLPWADESGQFSKSDAYSGAAIFQHRSHPDFPAQWTLRHYGFLGVAWPGNDRMALQPGEPVTLRYRIWIHRGDAEAGRVAEAYEAFRSMPAVHVAK